jgi:hypothetical protein
MQGARIRSVLALTAAGALTAVGVAGVAGAWDDGRRVDTRDRLSGYQEVPALSVPGSGSIKLKVDSSGDTLRYRLRYRGLESAVTQAHIHFENATNNGPVVAFLCSNLPSPPAGTPACPTPDGSVSGTIGAAQVLGNAADQGLAAGEFEELVKAIDAGATYANVHTANRPAGEIRGQLDHDHDHRDRH